MLLFILTVTVGGCTSPTTTSPTPPAPVTQTAQATSASRDFVLNFTPMGEAMAIGTSSSADAGNKYVLYDVALQNIAVNDLQLNPLFFELRGSNGSSYGIDLYATLDNSVKGFQVNTTQPGDIVQGTIIFQVPQSAQPVAIGYNDGVHNVTANL